MTYKTFRVLGIIIVLMSFLTMGICAKPEAAPISDPSTGETLIPGKDVFKVIVHPEGVAVMGFSPYSPADGTTKYLEPFDNGKIEFKDPSNMIATGTFYTYYNGNSNNFEVGLQAKALSTVIDTKTEYHTYSIDFGDDGKGSFGTEGVYEIPADGKNYFVMLGSQKAIFSNYTPKWYRTINITADFSKDPVEKLIDQTWTGTLSLVYIKQ